MVLIVSVVPKLNVELPETMLKSSVWLFDPVAGIVPASLNQNVSAPSAIRICEEELLTYVSLSPVAHQIESGVLIPFCQNTIAFSCMYRGAHKFRYRFPSPYVVLFDLRFVESNAATCVTEYTLLPAVLLAITIESAFDGLNHILKCRVAVSPSFVPLRHGIADIESVALPA